MKKFVVAAGLTLAMGASQAEANLITNGSFEECVGQACGAAYTTLTGTAGGTLQLLDGNDWGVYASIPGWTTTNGAGIEIQRGTVVAAKDGFSYVELDSHGGATNSTMSQSLMLGVGTYKLSFWYQPRTGSINDNGINVLFGGVQVGANPTADGVAPAAWSQYSFLLNVPTAMSYALTFSAVGAQNSLGGFVDDVQLVAVPEPASLLLLGAALAGVIARRRQ